MEQRTVNKLFTNYKRIVRPVSTQKVVHAFISENNNTQMSPETKIALTTIDLKWKKK